MRRAVCSSESAESASVVAFSLPPPQPGRRSRSSGRAVRDDEEWHVRDPFDELVHEVEERLVGPVQVLEDEDERAQLRHRLEEVAPGRERLGAPVSAELALACEADEGEEVRLDPRHIRVAR